MEKLEDRRCRPCEGGAEPLSRAQADTLLQELDEGWTLNADAVAIERDFEFPGFARTIAFANAVAFIATAQGHHPVMTVSYRRCRVSFTTHAIGGLSDNDFICAAKIDRLAEEL